VSAVEGVKGSGSVTLNLSAKGSIERSDQMAFTGSGGLRNATIQLADMAKPVAIRKADLRFNGNGAAFDDLDFSIGQTTAHGNLVMNNFASPNVQFSIAANHINVAEWEQLFQGGSQKSSGSSSSSGGDSFINKMTGTGSFTADTLVYDDLKLTNVQAP